MDAMGVVVLSGGCSGVSPLDASLVAFPVKGVTGVFDRDNIPPVLPCFAGVPSAFEGSINLGGTNFNESIIKGIITGMFVLRNLGYNWNNNMTVNGHSVSTRNDCLDCSDGMFSLVVVESPVDMGVERSPTFAP